MCGIGGYIWLKSCKKKNPIVEMMKVMSHRGPDDTGFTSVIRSGDEIEIKDGVYNDCAVAIGFDRLSIRDTSIRGHQPMYGRNGRVVLVFNGEIYNTEELKGKYFSNYKFTSSSDTEIILKLYENFGIEKTVELLNGMFAICIFDADTRKLHIVRDRVGIKPMFVAEVDDAIVFASEIKGILASGMISNDINKVAYLESLLFGHIYQNTLFKNIKQAPAGKIITYDIDSHENNQTEYWKLEAINSKNKVGFKQSKDELNSILNNVIKRQLVSDVSIGCQLSGGIDSSLISKRVMENLGNVTNGHLIKRIGYGIIPDDESISEKKWMHEAESVSNIELKEIQLGNQWMKENWNRAAYYSNGMEMPSSVGILKLSQEAKRDVTVLMSGEGADELFGGYPRMHRNIIKYFIAKILSLFHFDFSKIEKIGINYFTYGHKTKDLDRIKQNLLLHSSDSIGERLITSILSETVENKKDMMAQVVETRVNYIKELNSKEISFFDMMRFYDLEVRLPALLDRQDTMTMANSVENRVPFLDNEMIDFALKLPQKYLLNYSFLRKIRGGNFCEGKYILKTIVKDEFSESFAYRKKVGFSLAIKNYVMDFLMSEESHELFERLRRREIFDVDKIRFLSKKLDTFNHSDDEVILFWNLIYVEKYLESMNVC